MLYLLGFLCSPLAILLAGKPFQALFNLLWWAPIAAFLGFTFASMLYIGDAMAILIAIPILLAQSVLLFPSTIHAWFVSHNYYADLRQKRMERALHRENERLVQALVASNQESTQM